MSLSKKILSVVIVSFKSDKVIESCIQSIPETTNIVVVDNSNSKSFKDKLEKKYKNVKCILSSENLGMGAGNNLGLKHIDTDYAFILNPDLILHSEAINHIIQELKKNDSFGILAPISDDNEYPNYKIDNQDLQTSDNNKLLSVTSIDGYAMVLNLKRLKRIFDKFGNNFFDENFFMYLENDDLCKRIIDKGEKIFVLKDSKVKHLGAKAVDPKFKYEVELSRNWHWMWSKFYFNKKHYGYMTALIKGFPSFGSGMIKFFFYLIMNNKFKKDIYRQRVQGFICALLGKKSSYRPKIID